MGPGSISSIVVVVAVVADLAFAGTLTTTVDLPYPVSAAAELSDLAFATSNPIRTVVTVNSNRVDVLAADEKDVPKVLEKLRELCAGPFASLYPEICEHFETGGNGEDLDLDGLDPTIWWPPEDPTPQIITTASTRAEEPSSDPPSPVSSSPTLAEETGSFTAGKETGLFTISDPISSGLSESASDTSIPLLVTLTVPAEIKTTKTFEIVVHEVPDTGFSTSSPYAQGDTLDRTEIEDPTTFETETRSNSATSDDASINSVTAATLKDEYGTDNEAMHTLGKSEKPGPVLTSTTPSEETLLTVSTDVASVQSTSITEITDEAESLVSNLSTSSASEEPNTATETPAEPETSLDCPWKTDEDDEGPGPCTVITIWHTSVIHYGPVSTSASSRDPEFRPVFEPTAKPRPSRSRTSFDITLAEPPTTVENEEPTATPVWFTAALQECTQTVKLLAKLANNPLTSTVYTSTFTSTAFISCSCPNLATEYIGGYGLAVLPRTTTTILGTTTEKLVRCDPSPSPGTG